MDLREIQTISGFSFYFQAPLVELESSQQSMYNERGGVSQYEVEFQMYPA